MVAQQFIDQGHGIKSVLDNCSLSRSSYYYRPKQGGDKKGVPKSKYTMTQKGEYVCNDQVVKQIEELLSREFVDYGYIKVTHWLRQEYGYIINGYNAPNCASHFAPNCATYFALNCATFHNE